MRQARLTEPESPSVPDYSPAAVQLSLVDTVLADLIPRIGRCHIRIHEDPWEALFMAVSYQQFSGRVARRVCARIRSRCGGRLPKTAFLLDQPQGWLRQFGLTWRKEATLREIACRVESGELDLQGMSELPDRSVIEKLTDIRGIGEWTACMFLLFHLGREDVIMPGDLGIRKAIQLHYALDRLPSILEVLEHSRRWAPVPDCRVLVPVEKSSGFSRARARIVSEGRG